MAENEPGRPEPAQPTDATATTRNAPTMSPNPTTSMPREDLATQPGAAAAASTPPQRRASRVRWALALVLSVAVVALAAAATLLLTGQSSGSPLVGYVDGSSVAYAEARLDLPGDQRQKLGEFLSKFPGFDDQSILDRKIDEALDRIIGEASHGKQDWSTRIKPWFSGQVAIGVGQPEKPAASGDKPRVHGLVAVGVTNASAALAWLRDAIGSEGVQSQTYNGTELLVFAKGDETGAAAIADGKAMLVGDEASVKKAIDTHGNGAFAQTDAYKQARAATSGDHIGWAVVDMSHYLDLLSALPKAGGLQASLTPALKATLPPWVAVTIRAESDALAVDFVATRVPASDFGDNRQSDILTHLPASTIFVAEGHDLGVGFKLALDSYRQVPGLQEPMKQFDQGLTMLGGFDAVFGWMRDGAIVVTRNGSSIDGGVVLTPTDAAAAERLLTSIRGLVVLAGGQAGFKVSDEDHNGTTITTIDFGEVRDLLKLASGSSQVSPTMPLSGRVKLVYAVTDQLVAVGLGDSFVKSVLDTQAGSSLASDGRFKAATDRAGAANRGVTYVDIASIRELVEGLIPNAEMKAEYEREYRPYLVALKALVANAREDGSYVRGGEWLVVGK